MDRGIIGKNFHNLVLDLGEDYILTKYNGEEYKGKMSVISKSSSNYTMRERESFINGVATFPDIKSQSSFSGCYFIRETNPFETYILVSATTKDTTPYVAEVYAVECNAFVSLGYLTETVNEKMDRIFETFIYENDVKVYWDSSLQKQRRSTDGNFDQTLYYMKIPAKFGLSQDHVVIRKTFQKNQKTGLNEWIDVRFRVEAVDLARMNIDDDENTYGVLDVQMSLDTRD